jgi:hypothetical protein
MCVYSDGLALDYDLLLRSLSAPFELDALALDSGEPPHAEDAFLAELRSWLKSSSHTCGTELSVAMDLARDALDLVDGPEGPWQQLGIQAWLTQGTAYAAQRGLSSTQLRRLASDFVAWLGYHARLSLHAQRSLQRRIAAARIEIEPRAVAAERPLAA